MCLLDAVSSVGEMFSVLPPHLLHKYFMYVKNKLCEKQMLEIRMSNYREDSVYILLYHYCIKN